MVRPLTKPMPSSVLRVEVLWEHQILDVEGDLSLNQNIQTAFLKAHKGFDALEHFKTNERHEVLVLQAVYFFPQ